MQAEHLFARQTVWFMWLIHNSRATLHVSPEGTREWFTVTPEDQTLADVTEDAAILAAYH